MDEWIKDLADAINNRYELGLTDRGAKDLARLIERRVDWHMNGRSLADIDAELATFP